MLQVPDYEFLRNDTKFADRATPSPLVRDVCEVIKHIPGWFTIDDCLHFSLVLGMQSALGMVGDILEIGTYHGRSTCTLAYHLQAGERLVVNDVFDTPTNSPYTNLPSKEDLLANLRKVRPSLRDSEIDVHVCDSFDLKLPDSQLFRFIHIDGGHSKVEALNDLRLSAKHLMRNGIIVLDDYHLDIYPEVTVAADEFLLERKDFRVVADLNRHAAHGRKLYLLRS